MIYMFLGGIGSGKSVSAIREIVECQKKGHHAFTNFKMINKFRDYTRIKVDDIIIREKISQLRETNIPKYNQKINWKYWNEARDKYDKFSIYLDEAGYMINSRNSMLKKNKLLIAWVSQVRKILSDSPKNNLYFISQRFHSVDIGFRDLAHAFILCRSIKICNICKEFQGGCICYCKKCKNTIKTGCECNINMERFNVYVIQHIFNNYVDLENLDVEILANTPTDLFLANPYFKYYDTTEIIFGENEEYL